MILVEQKQPADDDGSDDDAQAQATPKPRSTPSGAVRAGAPNQRRFRQTGAWFFHGKAINSPLHICFIVTYNSNREEIPLQQPRFGDRDDLSGRFQLRL